MKEVIESQPGQQTMNLAVGSDQIVVKAGPNPTLKISPAPIRVEVWSPGDGQGPEAIFVLEEVRRIETVFSP